MLEASVDERTTFHGMIGCCPAMRKVFEQVERAARADTTVLVRGESGTGKELVAQAIHRNSPRKDAPFVALNVAAMPETLIESELFGHVEGAFTGANKGRVGRVEAAHGGTLFIDEIGDLELRFQVKLLRVLENHQITPVGSNEAKNIDVRLILATNQNLEAMVADGVFREDLYYRINVIAIHLPPLRERREDIPLLVDHTLAEVCHANGKPRAVADPELLQFLETYPWPGNVRQLYTCLESMVVLSNANTLTLAHLPAPMPGPGPGGETCCATCQQGALQDIVKAAVLKRLDRYRGNHLRTARSLRISPRTLQRRLKVWGNHRHA